MKKLATTLIVTTKATPVEIAFKGQEGQSSRSNYISVVHKSNCGPSDCPHTWHTARWENTPGAGFTSFLTLS